MIDERALRMMAYATNRLTTKEVAARLGCSPKAVRLLVKKGELRPFSVGRGFLFDEAEFEDSLEEDGDGR